MNVDNGESKPPDSYPPIAYPVNDGKMATMNGDPGVPPIGYPLSDGSIVIANEDHGQSTLVNPYPSVGYDPLNDAIEPTVNENYGESIIPPYPPLGYPPVDRTIVSMHDAASSSGDSSFPNKFFGEEKGNCHFEIVQPKLRKPADPRLLAVVEFFREFYNEKVELFRESFPAIYEELADVFKRLGEMFPQGKAKRIKVRTMKRSLSVGTIRSAKQGEESTITVERFKVRTLDVDVGGVHQVGKDDQDVPEPNGPM